MPVAHSDLPAALKTAHAALFERSFAAAASHSGWRDVATVTTLADNDRQTYHWFGTPPNFVDVDSDEVPFDGLNKFALTIIDKLWKNGLQIARRALEDDKLGLLSPRIQQMATAAEYFIGNRVLAQLNGSPTAYDGTALFADTRVIGSSANIDNSTTSAAAAAAVPTIGELQAVIGTVRGTMAAFQDDRGRVRNQTPDTIIYPSTHEQTLFQALNGASTPGSVNLVTPAGQGNLTEMNGYRLLRNPASDNAAEWFFAHTQDVVSPLIMQERLRPTLEAQTSAMSDSAIEEDAFRYTVRMRFEAGVGEPRHIIRHTFT